MQLKYSRFSHDVTKIQTKRLSILLTVYFHEVLQQLNNLLYTILRFAIEDAWISNLLRDSAAEKALVEAKNVTDFLKFCFSCLQNKD